MRVAILYFGIARRPEATVPSLRRHILDRNRDLDITTIAALNLPDIIDNPRSKESGILPRPEDVFHLGADHYLLARQSDAAIAEHLVAAQQAPDIFQDDWRSVRNLLHQLLSLKRGWSYCAQVLGGFDLYLFLRPDLDYLGDIDIAALAASFEGEHAIALPEWNSWGGFNDRFALAAPKAAAHYANRIDLVPGFCRNGRSLHGEMFLGEALQRGGCAAGLLPVEARRIRANGQAWTENFASKRIYLPPRPERFDRQAGNVLFDVFKAIRPEALRPHDATPPETTAVLAFLHRRRNVFRYLETQARPETLDLARGTVVAIGLEPSQAPAPKDPSAKTSAFPMASAAYFAEHNPRSGLSGPIDLALIDARGSAARALRDFAEVERFCTPFSLIVLEGVLPEGDGPAEGWRVLAVLRRLRPRLSVRLLRCRPHGLAVITSLDPASALLAEEMAEESAALAQPASAEAMAAFLASAEVETMVLPET